MVCDLPAKILTATGFNLILYFMTNLRREPGAFFIFFLFCFTMTLTMSMVFRTIASISRTLSQAMVPASLFILALTIYAGFAIPTRDMHVYFRWINYINPVAYAFESLMVNEFHNRKFPCSTFVPQGPGYAQSTGLEHICSTVGAVAGSAVVEGGKDIPQQSFLGIGCKTPVQSKQLFLHTPLSRPELIRANSTSFRCLRRTIVSILPFPSVEVIIFKFNSRGRLAYLSQELRHHHRLHDFLPQYLPCRN